MRKEYDFSSGERGAVLSSSASPADLDTAPITIKSLRQVLREELRASETAR